MLVEKGEGVGELCLARLVKSTHGLGDLHRTTWLAVVHVLTDPLLFAFPTLMVRHDRR
jgi:hypothetical protein